MTMPPSPADPGRAGSPHHPQAMRASDADRDRVADVLREAAGDGRLTLDELEDRLTAVYAARTYAELERITGDLPGAGGATPAPAHRPTGPAGDAPTWRSASAVMSSFRRTGVWTVPETFTAFAFWGGGKIDLREARFATGEVTIRAYALMGGIEVIVPGDLTVRVDGMGVMGGFGNGASGPGTPGAPRVTITGVAFWGAVSVKRRARREERKRRGRRRGRGDVG